MSTTNVPPIQFTPAGLILPEESAILTGVQEDYDAAFGGGLNPGLSTPQGQLATSETAIITEKNSEVAYIVNQVDPQYSSGRFQDAIARIYFLTRLPATSTAVTCILGGLPSTVIPAGTFAQDTSGNTYSLLGTVTIGSGGTVSSSWQNLATGPIACPAGTLTQVYQAIPGWDTITNAADGVPGQNVESQAEFELRRQASVAINSRGSVQAIKANVAEVPNVLDVYVIDNPSGNTVATGSTAYPMLPHSIYVGVVGGVDANIAQAIWVKKDDGCNYNGNTSVRVLDTDGYDVPYPSYQVVFNRPTDTPVKFAVQIVNSPTLPSNTAALIKAAIVAQFEGTNGSSPAKMGSLIAAANYYCPILASVPNLELLSVLVGLVTPTLNSVIMGIDQEPTLNTSDISVTLV